MVVSCLRGLIHEGMGNLTITEVAGISTDISELAEKQKLENNMK